MSKHIDLMISSPPSLDFPTYVGTQDEFGAPVQVGRWIEPSAEQPFWILRLTPAELLMYMIADVNQIAGVLPSMQAPDRTPVGTGVQMEEQIARRRPTSDRAALKAKLAGAKPKQPGAPPAPTVDPLATDKCPACHKLYDPALHELFDCSACGESKCTAHCFDSVADPCLDCQALQAGPEEGGFEPPAAAEIKTPELRAAMRDEARGAAQAVGNRLFDGVHHGPAGQDSAPADEDDE